MADIITPEINFDISFPSDIICALINGLVSLENTNKNIKMECEKLHAAINIYDRYLEENHRVHESNVESKEKELEKLHTYLDLCVSHMENVNKPFMASMWFQTFESTMKTIRMIDSIFPEQKLLMPWKNS